MTGERTIGLCDHGCQLVERSGLVGWEHTANCPLHGTPEPSELMPWMVGFLRSMVGWPDLGPEIDAKAQRIAAAIEAELEQKAEPVGEDGIAALDNLREIATTPASGKWSIDRVDELKGALRLLERRIRKALLAPPSPDREAMERARNAFVEGWRRGHNEGVGCGHPLGVCGPAHRDDSEALDDWEHSDARDALLGKGADDE